MAQRRRIYLDVCALNRLSDERNQERIVLEADAVTQTLGLLVTSDEFEWAASSVLEAEIERNPNAVVRAKALERLAQASVFVEFGPETMGRAQELELLGYGSFDAAHLAIAEVAGADLLTTDDRFMRRAQRNLGRPRVRVMNPVDWLQEVRR